MTSRGALSAAALCVLIGGVGRFSAQGVPAPKLGTVLPLPYTAGNDAIWGATGQDARGHIWFGISVTGLTPNTARLVEYVPDTGQFIERGDVVGELRRLSLLRPEEEQAKIHSKIVPGPGGYLYFSSMDEKGENENGSKLPIWGGHLWRLSLTTNRWEHLLRVPEALIAVGVGGRFVYTLGYFGHVVYQYDTQTGRTARLQVGSVDGHISRNFLVDARGHAYVPRLTAETTPQGRKVTVSLVEFDTDLAEIHATPIPPEEYFGSNSPTDAHGIVGIQQMADGSLAFTTHAGRLFKITPPTQSQGGADVADLGWIHPAGPSYPASLFTSDGKTELFTLALLRGKVWEWTRCTWPNVACVASPLGLTGYPDGPPSMLLYGSSTRDSRGGHYVVGMGPGYRPIVLRIPESTNP